MREGSPSSTPAALLALLSSLILLPACDSTTAAADAGGCSLDTDCPPGQSCAGGACLATDAGQPGPDASVTDAGEPDPCAGITCSEGKACRDGICVDARCLMVECAESQTCVAGTCFERDCPGAECGELEVCREGRCSDRRCIGVECPSGQHCEEGACAACQQVELICDDGLDADCDGTIDCADSDCDSKGCDDGDSCTVDERCVAGACTGGEPRVCEEPPGDCYEPAGSCSSGACSYPPRQAGASCSYSGDPCLVGACDGAGACAPSPAPDGTPCGDGETMRCLSGVCAPLEGTCQILGATVPAGSSFLNSCQLCDPQLNPNDWTNAPSTKVCRAAEGDCDLPDTCDSGACPDRLREQGAVCRAAAGLCDIAEQCSGSEKSCPPDSVVMPMSGVVCRPGNDICDPSESCEGGPDCPQDVRRSDGEACGTEQICIDAVCTNCSDCAAPGCCAAQRCFLASCAPGCVCAGTCVNESSGGSCE